MNSGIVIGFDAIVIFSLFFGLLVLSTAILSSRVHRSPVWYGLLAPFFMYDIIFILGMGYQNEVDPPLGFCAFQAILLYSVPGWAVVAFDCFVILFYLEMKNRVIPQGNGSDQHALSGRTRRLLVYLPPLSFVFFLLLNGLTILLSKETHVASSNYYKLYCKPETRIGLYVGGTIMSVAMIIWFFIIVRLGILFRTHSTQLYENEVFNNSILPVYFRVIAISIAGSFALCLYILRYATQNMDNILDSYGLGLPSIIVFFIFATQRDILQCWAFWYRPHENNIEIEN